jgi:hypothetical protein
LADVSAGHPIRDTVLIEADKLEDLRDAYPNYFGDVRVFTRNLQLVTTGKEAVEYTAPPKPIAPSRPVEAADMSWFNLHRRRQW